ncbi:MAG: hypothetical protein FIA99_19550 [Ruminiclostridium sp.]|nr:hypothetical protein [Ruminiclostridium sp.]
MKRIRVIYLSNYRKKAALTLGILVFWILMFLTASFFTDSNSELDASAKRLVEYSSYESPEGGFTFNYPSTFILTPRSFYGSDIPYHVDFKDTAGFGYGFVQIWNMSIPLGEFLEKSKEASQLHYKYFSGRKIRVNGFTGYYWDYSVLGSNNTYYKGNEVFLEGKNKMYRISYFIPENQWNETQKKIFTNMVKSFRKL